MAAPATSPRYDALGRLLSYAQCTLASCTAPNTLTYAYDLAGNSISATNGLSGSQSPSVSWTSQYDTAGRLSKVTSTWSDSAHPPTLFEADQPFAINGVTTSPYGPIGLTAAQYGVDPSGTTSALLETRAYDPRLRLTSKAVYPGSAEAPQIQLTVAPTSFVSAYGTMLYVHVGCNSGCGTIVFTTDGWQSATFGLDGNGNLGVNTYYWGPSFAVGQHTMTATFQPYSGGAPSTQSAPFTVIAPGNQPTVLSLAMSTTSFTIGEDAVAYVHVDCNSACGNVEFDVDGQRWVEWPLDDNGNTSADTYYWFNSGLFTVSAHTLTAIYLGTQQNATATQSVPFTINPVGTEPSTLTLTMNPSTFSISQDDVTAFVNVSCSNPTGMVKYMVDSNLWVSWPLDANGTAYPDTLHWASANFTPGAHTVTANYLGNSTCAASTNSVSITVTP